MGVNVFGFHTSIGGNMWGWGDHIRALDNAGIPVTIKPTDDYGPCDELVALARASGVPHLPCFRMSEAKGDNIELPIWTNDPIPEAGDHWTRILTHLPQEFDKDFVHLEVMNEPAKEFGFDTLEELQASGLESPHREQYQKPNDTRWYLDNAEWLGIFADAISDLSLAAGYMLSLFGWSTGEPEYNHWTKPSMLGFLQKCALHKDRLSIALHEYSLDVGSIMNGYPFLIGRFHMLFDVCDNHGIDRPTVLITEWGWTNIDVPDKDPGMEDIIDIASLLEDFPEIRMAAIWHVGGGYGGIANKAQKFIAPLTEYALTTTPPNGGGNGGVDCMDTTIGVRYHMLRPQALSPEQWNWIRDAMTNGIDVHGDGVMQPVGYEGWSHIDAMKAILDAAAAGHSKSRLIVVDGHLIGTGLDQQWMADNCPALSPYTTWRYTSAVPPGAFRYEVWPTDFIDVTQQFGVNPENYIQFGLPGHDGIDMRALLGSDVKAVAPGTVYRIHTNPNTHNYGIHVRIKHADGIELTIYGHLLDIASGLAVGQSVQAGQVIGRANDTGNSFGNHLHLGRKRLGETYTDPNGAVWAYNLFDPTPLIKHLAPEEFPPLPPPTPPPATGPARLGLHASADPGDLKPSEFDLFRDAKVEVIKVLSGHGGPSIARLALEHPGAPFIIRAFLDFGGRVISSQQFFDDTINDVTRAINHIPPGHDIYIELHNEPNLVPEGYLSSWMNGSEFNQWLLEVLDKYKQVFPSVFYMYPGLSPGPEMPGFRQYYIDFYNQSRGSANACDTIAIHAYWNTLPGTNYPMDSALAVIDGYIVSNPSKQFWITESCNNKMDTTENKANQYIAFWNELRRRPPVQGVTYYVASASNPIWGWGAGGTGQVWEGTDIASIVGRR